jgi:hypothetical protein
MKMREMKWMIARGVFPALLLIAPAAHAQVTGSFDGSLTGKKLPEPVAVAAVVSQTDTQLTGTVALPADLGTVGGEYLVTGKATKKRVKLSGTGAGGVAFKWRAKIDGDTLAGKAKVKGPGQKIAGKLTMARNVFASDGSGCDAVYDDNQALFDGEVLGQALVSCTTCHAPGLQAGATRLHVTMSDPLATARGLSLFVDPLVPAASRILQKPLNVLPHGGGLQLVAGSDEEQILMQWVDLVAQAGCN